MSPWPKILVVFDQDAEIQCCVPVKDQHEADQVAKTLLGYELDQDTKRHFYDGKGIVVNEDDDGYPAIVLITPTSPNEVKPL